MIHPETQDNNIFWTLYYTVIEFVICIRTCCHVIYLPGGSSRVLNLSGLATIVQWIYILTRHYTYITIFNDVENYVYDTDKRTI